MLKEVMIGAGGIMLAAAIFASSMTPQTNGDTPPVPEPVPIAAPAPPAQIARVAPRAQPQPVFPADSGDSVFGAPMIEALPVDSLSDGPIAPEPDTGSDEPAGRQFNARPGRSYPVPR